MIEMPYQVGDRISYPHHGASVIESIETRVIDGVERKMYKARPVVQNIVLLFPVDNAEKIGIRPIISKEDAQELLDGYFVKKEPKAVVWSRRYKNNIENLKSGDFYQIAEVVRELSLSEKPLSAAEKRQCQDAMQKLVSELALSLEVTYEEAENLLEKTIQTAS